MNHIIILSDSGFETASKIKIAIGGSIEGLLPRCTKAEVGISDLKAHLQSCFEAGEPIIAVMASGALIRLVAPFLKDKQSEPPVLAIAEDGSSVVPLLGGHHGANDLAREIADAIEGHAAITTAGDLKFGIALDAPPSSWVLANPESAKRVMAELIGGKEVRLQGNCLEQAEWLTGSVLPIDDDGDVVLTATDLPHEVGALELVYHPQNHVLGVGCERGTSSQEVQELVSQAIEMSGIARGSIAGVVSIDLKADETAIHSVGKMLGRPVRFFDAATLEKETARLINPSDVVFTETGCHGVCEGAALAASGTDGELILPKIKSKRATVAIARSPKPLDITSYGQGRGRLFVVGIGPGQEAWRSPEVTRMIGVATDLVGYTLYLDLIAGISTGKTRHDFDLGREEDRVRHAMELAGEGKDVALVCSGDAGIYAMATLVFELFENGGLSPVAMRIAVECSPGISALQAAASRAGAPLGHDFCTISLSDLLTTWDAIQMRIKAAAEGDFVIAFYNPVSRRRRTQLAHAKEVLLQHRPDDTPVILATNLGREGELVRTVPLAKLDIEEVDMLTVVIVGSTETRTVQTGDGKNWVYTPRGYAAKEGTKIKSEAAE